MTQFIRKLTYLLLFSFVLPAGSILKIPVKIILVLILSGIIVLKIIAQSGRLKCSSSVKYMIILFIMTTPWAMLSIINGYEIGLSSFLRVFISFLSVIIITQLGIDNAWIDIEKALKIIYQGAIFLVVTKLLIELLLIFNIISYDMCFYIFSDILDSQWMSLYFQMGPITFYRITMSNDIIPLLLYSYDLACNKRSLSVRIVEIIAMALYVMIVYSRVVIFQFIVVTLFALLIELKESKINKNQINLILRSFIIILIGIVVLTYNNGIIIASIKEGLNFRFSEVQVKYSDGARIQQLYYLLKGFWKSPIIGNGLGAFVKGHLRSTINPHSYELEYLSFLYQLGLIGFFLIIGGLVFVFYKMSIYRVYNRTVKSVLILNFLIWLIKPIFNPGFLSSSSGMVIVSIILLALQNYNISQKSNKYVNIDKERGLNT